MLHFKVNVSFCRVFPLSGLPVDLRAEIEVGLRCEFFAQQGKRQGKVKDSLPWNVLQMIFVSSSTVLWLYVPWNNRNLFRSHF